MKTLFQLTPAVCLLLLFSPQTKSQEQMKSQTDKAWQAFEMGDLQKQLAQSGKAWLPFLDVSTLNCGVYVLGQGAEDRQSPHKQDEVYYVLEGEATLEVNNENIPAKQGSVIFVKAGAVHRFVNIRKDLKLLVFFSTAESE